jgi:quercetin dioxygenase-like cupin family protein
MSVFVDWDSLVPEETPTGTFASVFNAPVPTLDRLDVSVRSLRPGTSWTPPADRPEQVLVVKDGVLEVSINGAVQRAVAKDLVFFAANDAVSVASVGSADAVFHVLGVYTELTGKVGDRQASGDEVGSFVKPWDSIVPTQQVLKEGETVPWYRERRSFVPASPTVTSPRFFAHATTVDPGSPSSSHGRHRWVVLFVMLEGTMEFNVEGVVHNSGAGSFFYMTPEALHTQIPVGNEVTSYYVIHFSSASTPLNP